MIRTGAAEVAEPDPVEAGEDATDEDQAGGVLWVIAIILAGGIAAGM